MTYLQREAIDLHINIEHNLENKKPVKNTFLNFTKISASIYGAAAS